jgi:hypothetical protein
MSPRVSNILVWVACVLLLLVTAAMSGFVPLIWPQLAPAAP